MCEYCSGKPMIGDVSVLEKKLKKIIEGNKIIMNNYDFDGIPDTLLFSIMNCPVCGRRLRNAEDD